MISALRVPLPVFLLLASMTMCAVATAADLTARQLVDRVLASKAKYRTLAATVEKTLSSRLGGDEWQRESRKTITWRWRAAEDVWFLEFVEQRGQGAEVRKYAKRKDCLKMFESWGGGRGGGKVVSLASRQDRHMGCLTPDTVLWDPSGYSWDAYVKGAQKLVHKEGIYYLTSSVVGGRAVVTIAVDPDHGYLPTMYEVKRPEKADVFMRYSSHDLREVNGLWFPFRYEMVVCPPDGKDTRGEFEVREIAVNQPIPDEQLDFRFPPGSRVSYETKLLRLKMALERVPRKAEKAPAPVPPVASPAPPKQPTLVSHGGPTAVPATSAGDAARRSSAQPTAPAGEPPGAASRWTSLRSIAFGLLLIAVVLVLLRRGKGKEEAQ